MSTRHKQQGKCVKLVCDMRSQGLSNEGYLLSGACASFQYVKFTLYGELLQKKFAGRSGNEMVATNPEIPRT